MAFDTEMINYLPAIFALMVAAAGWFYIFYSRAAVRLQSIESAKTNRLRVRLRQIGGSAMILLAAAFYAGTVAIDHNKVEQASACFFVVVALMATVIILALIDLRLTNQLRKSRRDQDQL
jgi:Kef-type K+ transport system membrane component KefB